MKNRIAVALCACLLLQAAPRPPLAAAAPTRTGVASAPSRWTPGFSPVDGQVIADLRDFLGKTPAGQHLGTQLPGLQELARFEPGSELHRRLVGALAESWRPAFAASIRKAVDSGKFKPLEKVAKQLEASYRKAIPAVAADAGAYVGGVVDAAASGRLSAEHLQASMLDLKALGAFGPVASLEARPVARLASALLADAQRLALALKQGANPFKDEDAAQAPAPLEDAEVRGKTLLLVGTRAGSQSFIHKEVAEVSRRLGLNLVILDKPEARERTKDLVDDAHFIPVPIDGENAAEAAKAAIGKALGSVGSPVQVVANFLAPYAALGGRLTTHYRARGVSEPAAVTADAKDLTRAKLANSPGLAVAFRTIASAAEARQAWKELGGGRFVIKTVRGEGTLFIAKGVDSEEEAEEEFLKMDAGLKEYAKRDEAKGTAFAKPMKILIERELERAPGTEEVSIEYVMQNGRAVIAMPSDTKSIGKNEQYPGGSLTFPSQQSPRILQAFVAHGESVLQALGYTDGPARVDMIMTHEGPALIEVNPRMGGGLIGSIFQRLTGVSLVEQIVRALLGLRVDPGRTPDEVADYRFSLSQTTGKVASIEGVDEAKASPGIERLKVLVEAGDEVYAPKGASFNEIVELLAVAKTYAQAKAWAIAALRKIVLRVTTEQTAAAEQPEDSPR